MTMKGSHWKYKVYKHTFSANEEQETKFEEENETEQSDDELDNDDDSIFGYVKKMKQKERLKLVNMLLTPNRLWYM